ncbi:RING finger protein 11-like [Tachyglossus aculeatus]|uniref:RING finger protein 11-like n=1 Tax=Tachyglossus aculeatus TaxID=9261 RepID=UPI0018F368EF|nr:RING finger protein 11-like [Tachyglossus aculeatus]
MGNCLASEQAAVVDDLSPLNDSGDGTSLTGDLVAPSPSLEENMPSPVYHPTPSQTQLATQFTEEEQIRIAQIIGLIQHLPTGIFDPGPEASGTKNQECVICMQDLVSGDSIRFLPCLHIYHVDCIDTWLIRSLTCPSCMEPVDAALLAYYEADDKDP